MAMLAHDLTELERQRPYLLGVAYRLLGSASDAEDVVQEALLRASGAGELHTPRAYLTTVVTRLCLDELRSARRRRVDYVGPWLPEPLLTTRLDASEVSGAEHRENVSLAFLLLLEQLSPLERAVFVLREVFDLEFPEIAQALGRSEAACRKLLSRARTHVTQRREAPQAAAAEQLAIASAFFAALGSGDLNQVIKLLADDVVSTTDHGGKVSAAQKPVVGPERVARFFVGLIAKALRAPLQLSWEVAFVNGAPALLVKHPDGHLETALVLRITEHADGARIGAVQAIRNPDKLTALRARLTLP
jgi:RNA polymerase sigma-70 factor (ECF subfamily)